MTRPVRDPIRIYIQAADPVRYTYIISYDKYVRIYILCAVYVHFKPIPHTRKVLRRTPSEFYYVYCTTVLSA